MQPSLLLALLMVSAHAGTPAMLRDFVAGPYAGQPEEAARSFLAEQTALGDLPAQLGWETVRVVDRPGRSLVRLQQTVEGVPVEGGGAVVRVRANGTVDLMTSHLIRGISAGTSPVVTGGDAERSAWLAVPGRPTGQDGAHLVLRPDRQGGRLLWETRVATLQPLSTFRVRVDALSGEIVETRDMRVYAKADVFAENPIATPDLAEVDLLDLPKDASVLDGDFAYSQSVVFVKGKMEYTQYAQADEDGDFFYEPTEPAVDDGFAEVMAYHHGVLTRDWFLSRFDHDFRGLILIANYRDTEGADYDNAYSTYTPEGDYLLAMGQGIVDLAYDANVITHEFGHGIVEDLTHVSQTISYPIGFDEYGLHAAPHAMNEGLADYFSSTIAGNPESAEYFGSAFGKSALRNLQNDNKCPDDVLGEAHDDGLIMGGMAWDIREAVGADAADAIIYEALATTVVPPSWSDFGDAIQAAADDMVISAELDQTGADSVRQILADRGFTRCGRSIALASDVTESGIWLGADFVSAMMGGDMCGLARDLGIILPMPFQYSFTTPAAEEGEMLSLDITVALDDLYGGTISSDDLQYVVWLRKGEMVTFSTRNIGSMLGIGDYVVLDGALDFDQEIDDQPELITLSPDDATFPLEPSTTYYLAAAGLNCPITNFSLTPVLTMADVATEEEKEKKCGCAAAPSGAGAIGLLVGLGALCARRRRSPAAS